MPTPQARGRRYKGATKRRQAAGLQSPARRAAQTNSDKIRSWRCTPTPSRSNAKAGNIGPTAEIFRECMDSEIPSRKPRPASSKRCGSISKSAVPPTGLYRAPAPSSWKPFLSRYSLPTVTVHELAFRSHCASRSRTRKSYLHGAPPKRDRTAKYAPTRKSQPASGAAMDERGCARRAHIVSWLALGPLAPGCYKEPRIPGRRER